MKKIAFVIILSTFILSLGIFSDSVSATLSFYGASCPSDIDLGDPATAAVSVTNNDWQSEYFFAECAFNGPGGELQVGTTGCQNIGMMSNDIYFMTIYPPVSGTWSCTSCAIYRSTSGFGCGSYTVDNWYGSFGTFEVYQTLLSDGEACNYDSDCASGQCRYGPNEALEGGFCTSRTCGQNGGPGYFEGDVVSNNICRWDGDWLCIGGYYNAGYGCTKVGYGYYSGVYSDRRDPCPSDSSTTTETSSSPNHCLGNPGYYNCEDGTCNEVGYGYYSGSFDNNRYSCPPNSYTSSTLSGYLEQCRGNAGYYNCEDGTCNVAGAGYYSPALDNDRYQCSAGFYGSSTTNSVDTCNGACTAGYYCPAGSTSATQNKCGYGNYCPEGSGSPISCPANSYTSTDTASSISQCLGNAGYYGCADGTCNVVGYGYYSPALDNDVYGCPTNSYTSTTTSSAISQCLGNAGYYSCADGTCNVVGYGYYSPALDNSRYACPTNSYTSGTTSSSRSQCLGNAGYYSCADGTCNVVGYGYYSPALDNSRYACPTNSYTSTTTSSAISQCLGNAGYYNCEDGTCNVAGAGYYSPALSNSRYQCAAGYYGSSTTNSVSTCNGLCACGHYCPAGSTSSTQTDCAAGTYRASTGGASQSDCTSASIGYYAPGGTCSQTGCGAGTYTGSTGQSSCTTCQAGYYCVGSANRAACPAGTYGSTTGLTTSSCTGPCAAGYYGSSTAQTASTCNGPCACGHYCPAGSTSSTQTDCSAGTYRASTGGASQADCSNCGADTYSGAGACSCTNCAVNQYSYAGSSSCTPIPTPSITSVVPGNHPLNSQLGSMSITQSGSLPTNYEYSLEETSPSSAERYYGTSTSYSHTGLSDNTRYCYRTRMQNVQGSPTHYGPWSGTVCGITPDRTNNVNVSLVAGAKEGIVGYWSFDEGSGLTASDSTWNNNDGTLINGPEWTDGKYGHSLKFDGVDDYAYISNVNPTDEITVSAWVKSSSSNGYSGIWQLISKYDAYILGSSLTGSKEICFIIYDTTWRYGSCYTVPDPDNWHHFIGTYDSSTKEKKLYVDGILRSTSEGSGKIKSDEGPLHIGHREYVDIGNDHFDGYIDNVHIYDRALSPEEITSLYRAGVQETEILPGGLHYYEAVSPVTQNYTDVSIVVPLNVSKAAPSGSITINPSSTVTYPTESTASCSQISGDSGTTLTLKRDSSTVSTGASPSETETLGNGTYAYTCEYPATQNYTSAVIDTENLYVNKGYPTIEISNGTSTLSTEGLVGYWRFENETLGKAKDYSGYGNDGTLTSMDNAGSSTSGPTSDGMLGKAMKFDGTDDYIDTEFDGTEHGTIAISFWAKSDELSGSHYILDNSPGSAGYIIRQEGSLMYFYYYFNTDLKSRSITIPDTSWHHYVAMINSTSISLIMDAGAKKTSMTFSSSYPVVSIYKMNIGADISPGSYWKGNIDELMIFNRMLSDDEVSMLYQSTKPYGQETSFSVSESDTGDADGAYITRLDSDQTLDDYVGYWAFDEGRGSSVYDMSLNGNDGTLINGPEWTDGKYGHSLKFDGVDDYVITDGLSFSEKSEITVGFWVKPISLTGEWNHIIEHVSGDWNGVTINTAGKDFRYAFTTNSGNTGWTSTGIVPSMNTWYYVVYSYNGTFVNFFLDGVNRHSIELSGTFSFDEYHIGHPSAYTPNVVIDEVRVYDRALSTEEITSLYKAGLSETEILPGGLHYYEAVSPVTQNYTEVSIAVPVNITKVPSTVNLYLDGTDGDRSYNQWETATITATSNIETMTLGIDANYTGYPARIATGTTPVTNYTNTGRLPIGVYSITAHTLENENYTSSSTSHNMHVKSLLKIYVQGYDRNVKGDSVAYMLTQDGSKYNAQEVLSTATITSNYPYFGYSFSAGETRDLHIDMPTSLGPVSIRINDISMAGQSTMGGKAAIIRVFEEGQYSGKNPVTGTLNSMVFVDPANFTYTSFNLSTPYTTGNEPTKYLHCTDFDISGNNCLGWEIFNLSDVEYGQTQNMAWIKSYSLDGGGFAHVNPDIYVSEYYLSNTSEIRYNDFVTVNATVSNIGNESTGGGDDAVRVELYLDKVLQSVNYTDTLGPAPPKNSSWTTLHFTAPGAGVHLLTINTTLNPPPVKQEWNYSNNNVSMYIIVYSGTRIPSVIPSTGTPVRGDSLGVDAKLVYENGTAVAGQNLDFTDETASSFMGTGATNSSGYGSVSYSIPSTNSIGPHRINVTYDGNEDSFAYSSHNDSVVVDVYSKANVSFVTTSQTIQTNKRIMLEALVLDSRNDSIVNGYVCKFYDSTSLLSTVSTNSSGICAYNWDTSGQSTGEHYIHANIADNSSMYYFADSPYNTDSITVTINSQPSVTTPMFNNTTSPAEFERGQGIEISCDVVDLEDSADSLEVKISVFSPNNEWSNVTVTDRIGSTFYRNYQTVQSSSLGDYLAVCSAEDTDGGYAEDSSEFLLWQNGTVSVELNSTVLTYGEGLLVYGYADYIDGGHITTSDVLVRIFGHSECGATTNLDGYYSCEMSAPNSLGKFTVITDVTDKDTMKVITNSTVFDVAIAYGEEREEMVTSDNVGCYEVPRIIQNPDGSIEKVTVRICVWE